MTVHLLATPAQAVVKYLEMISLNIKQRQLLRVSIWQTSVGSGM